MSLSWGIPTDDAFVPWLRKVKQLGYVGVSGFAHWGWAPFLEKPQVFARLLANEGLELAALDAETVADIAYYEPIFDLMNEAKCRQLVCLSARRDVATIEDEIKWLQQIGTAAAARSIDACHHPRTMGVSALFDHADRVMRETDPEVVHLVIETGHSTKDFVDLPVKERTVTLIRAHARRIRLVELKDHAETTDLNTPLGEGQAPLDAICSALVAAKYVGWLVVEQNGNDGLSLNRPFEETARISRALVRSVFGV